MTELTSVIFWTRLSCHSTGLSLAVPKSSVYFCTILIFYFLIKNSSKRRISNGPYKRPDQNPIENRWSIVKIKLYDGGNSKADLWEAIKMTIVEIEPTEVKT